MGKPPESSCSITRGRTGDGSVMEKAGRPDCEEPESSVDVFSCKLGLFRGIREVSSAAKVALRVGIKAGEFGTESDAGAGLRGSVSKYEARDDSCGLGVDAGELVAESGRSSGSLCRRSQSRRWSSVAGASCRVRLTCSMSWFGAICFPTAPVRRRIGSERVSRIHVRTASISTRTLALTVAALAVPAWEFVPIGVTKHLLLSGLLCGSIGQAKSVIVGQNKSVTMYLDFTFGRSIAKSDQSAGT